MSCDSVFSHVAWQKLETGMLSYPLCSDFYPHGATAEKYGIFRSKEPLAGINERAVFVIDKEGIIRYTRVYELGDVPDNEEVFQVLQELAKVAAK